MTPVQVLGACGLTSATLSFAFGLSGRPWLMSGAGTVMIFGNIYARIARSK